MSLYDEFFGGADLLSGSLLGTNSLGFPVRGESVPFTKQREYEELPLRNKFRHDFFCLWVPADVMRYREVMAKFWNGTAFVKFRRDFEVPDPPAVVEPDGATIAAAPGGSLKIYLEWTEPYVDLDAAARANPLGPPGGFIPLG